jgi:hypothetical protein
MISPSYLHCSVGITCFACLLAGAQEHIYVCSGLGAMAMCSVVQLKEMKQEIQCCSVTNRIYWVTFC